jgi:adenine-specific DNA-methyltransferase
MSEIEPIAAGSPETQSTDLKAENIAALKALFPELLTERIKDGKTEAVINIDVLKQLVGDATASDAEEKYGLNWHGKRRARQIALTPSTGTLRPCPEESVDWETTQNLMIEGDNLEVLKLLQKSYAGKVKLIYIDPPYNTGKDFVYPDSFQDNIKNYLELTGQVEGGAKITSNTEASGRFHTDWLNMMYPRLRLARSLLREDGLLFVSIDDNEAQHMKVVLNELFGEENFLAQIMWQKMYSGKADATHFGRFHEYILCYCKNIESAQIKLLPRTEAMNARYTNPDDDTRGPWLSNDLTAAGERSAGHYEVLSPAGKVFDSPDGKHWLYSQETMEKLVADKRIFFGRNGDAFPRLKRFLTEVQQGRRVNTIWLHGEVGHTDEGTKEVRKYFPSGIEFQAPKPTRLLKQILAISTEPNAGDIVLDFFAGSGSTADAVLQANSETDGNARFIAVQLPEPIENSDFRHISDFTKERIRRASSKIRAENPLFIRDTGFRVFKLDTSNIRAWSPNRSDLEGSLFANIEHVQPGRSDTDVLYELLLKLGLDLCVPIETRELAGKTVHSIGGGVLMACLELRIAVNEAEALALGMAAWRKEQAPAGETTAVFRDSAFENDVAKSNLAAILQQHDIAQVRSL